MNSQRTHTHRGLQVGLTLIELMVSLAIGLVILAAMSTLFVRHNQHQVELDKANRLIDNGRYALELLSSNLRLAGYYGEFDPSSAPVPGTLPDACKVSGGVADLTEIRNGIAFPLQGYDAADTATSAGTVGTCALTDLKPGSDVVVIRRVSTTSEAVPATTTQKIYLQGSQCPADTAPAYVDTIGGAPAFYLDKDRTELIGRILDCAPALAPVARLITEVYFIASDNVSGDGIPTLKKVELKDDGTFSAPVPLVEGIEFLQLSYGIDGIDNNGDGDADDIGIDANSDGDFTDVGDTLPDEAPDGIPNVYSSCATTTCDNVWNRVVSVKIYLLARNSEASKDTNDTRAYNLGPGGAFSPTGAARTYKRQAYIQTVRLVNAALRREQP